jgi:hypothetical protein
MENTLKITPSKVACDVDKDADGSVNIRYWKAPSSGARFIGKLFVFAATLIVLPTGCMGAMAGLDQLGFISRNPDRNGLMMFLIFGGIAAVGLFLMWWFPRWLVRDTLKVVPGQGLVLSQGKIPFADIGEIRMERDDDDKPAIRVHTQGNWVTIATCLNAEAGDDLWRVLREAGLGTKTSTM